MSRSYKKRKNIYVHNQMFSEICDMNNYIFGYKSIYLSMDYLYQSKLSKGNKTVYCKNSVLNKYIKLKKELDDDNKSFEKAFKKYCFDNFHYVYREKKSNNRHTYSKKDKRRQLKQLRARNKQKIDKIKANFNDYDFIDNFIFDSEFVDCYRFYS